MRRLRRLRRVKEPYYTEWWENILGAKYQGENTCAEQLMIDLAHRSIDETYQLAHKIIEFFYGSKAEYSCFSGGSNGGKEGVVAARKFPTCFDGIMIGFPAQSYVSRVWRGYWATKDGITVPKHAQALYQAIYDKFDSLEGLIDAEGNEHDYNTTVEFLDIDGYGYDSVAFNMNENGRKDFYNAGGKIIQYHGWGDFTVPGMISTGMYDELVETLGEEKTAATRPLPPYPYAVRYNSTGSTYTATFNVADLQNMTAGERYFTVTLFGQADRAQAAQMLMNYLK